MGSVGGFHVNYGNNLSSLWYGEADVFMGIPFAEPPVGEKRFQMPVPIMEYPNRRVNATKFKAACVQPDMSACSVQSEDCLYLNVITPNANAVHKYPGIVRNLVSRGVVVVTIQYRLNIPGFFTTSTDEFPANRGMLDQVEALRWVQNNIDYFGGNPYSVTIFGQSAGSISVSAHTYSPLSQGLFQQGIMESGALFTSLEGSLGTLNMSQDRAFQLCNFTDQQWNNGDFADLKSCMEKTEPSAWVNMDKGTLFGWRLLLDKCYLPDTPEKLNKKRPMIPMIIGNMRDEFASTWYYQMSEEGIPFEYFSANFVKLVFDAWGTIYGDRIDDVWNIVKKSYVAKGTNDSDAAAWWIDSCTFFTAASFAQFAVQDAIMYSAAGNKEIYLYEQTYGSRISHSEQADEVTKKLGGYRPVPHSTELPYVFMYDGVWESAISQNRTQPFDFELADWYGKMWTNFAQYGRPTLTEEWKSVESPSNLWHFNIENPEMNGMKMLKGYRDIDLIVFTNAISKLIETSPPTFDREKLQKAKESLMRLKV
ncbi:unnamed protein product, partial [Mesorhabditis belari]|uniref:Carboxylic ester hydrolase n=1 Tax=Mesorhabditis belari TaxID=2138241 RepID=A0AAF3F1A6_9BILA